ncbi:MAG TPA: glycoside hydrolase family 15 protein [Trebonia sp.]|nr:glycoside hydrolase family 15 protein [Trebonia sp.]
MTAMLSHSRTQFARSASVPDRIAGPRQRVQPAFRQADLRAVAQHMYSLMIRNVASDGFAFVDPVNPERFSRPGCVIAAPSYPASQPGIDQDYVFNWTRDAAITAIELAAAAIPTAPGANVQPVIDYVNFAKACQDNATPTLAHACFTIEGESRPWTEQSDGPALQTLAMLQGFGQLDAQTQGVAAEVIGKNVDFLLATYREPTTNLWEEHYGYSFFARSAQLRCLRAISANSFGIAVPQGTSEAIGWLEWALQGHWNGTFYVSVIDPSSGEGDPAPVTQWYDPNIDIVQASVYGAVAVTDTRLLATAGQLRRQWAAGASASAYPINIADRSLGIGPMMGRYPGDTYDGDVAEPVLGGHPWALCTANFAELYYRLASQIASTQSLPYDALSAEFFGQAGIAVTTPWNEAADALERAGDAMLRAVIYHSDHLELSEQFDGTSGYEKSVRDLTWSYAAFLSAVRARTARHVQG